MLEFQKLDSKSHDRKGFICAQHPVLAEYLQTKARKESNENLSRCFVAIDDELSPPLVGYYTLSSASVPKDEAMSYSNIGLVSYRDVPVTIIGRLAVDSRHQGKGYGKIILAEALKTVCAYAEHIGTKGVIVDAKDDASEKFYLKFGFIKSLEPGKRRLFIPISTIKTAIN